jgi:putative oxidoreductase
MKNAWLASGREPVLSVVRIVSGFTYLAHGLQKSLGLLGGAKFPQTSLMGMVGDIELIGGILIMLGLFTRPVAFLLSGYMAVVYFSQHAARGFWPVVNKGELAVLYCFLFFYFVFSGPGAWSLDALRRRGGKGD